MTIKYVEGDLFINKYNAQAFAHGVNCLGIMGAGIAVEFKNRYPEMYDYYYRRCKQKTFHLGDCLWWEENGKIIFNLFTQEGLDGADYRAIENSLRDMRKIAERSPKTYSIAMPKIGAGLGGLNWNIIKDIIETVFYGWYGTLYVYEKYKPNV